MANAQKNELPNFIKARDPKELRALMLANSIRLSMTVQYFDMQFAQGKWWAWYYEPLFKSSEVKELEHPKAK
jgi:hypothetical protein